MAVSKRRPNKTGSVTKSKDYAHRHRPWRARVLTGYKENGTPIFKGLGFYKMRGEAEKAIWEYMNSQHVFKSEVTFADIFKDWSEEEYPKHSKSFEHSFNAAYKHLKVIHNKKVQELSAMDYEKVIKESKVGPHTQKVMQDLIYRIDSMAIRMNIKSKLDSVKGEIKIDPIKKSHKHYPFNESDLKKLWAVANDNPKAQIILVLIYTGVRPGELFSLEKRDVHLNEQWFYIRKSKTENGIRNVPIHDKILPFFESRMETDGDYVFTKENGYPFDYGVEQNQYAYSYFNPVLKELGIMEFTNQETLEKGLHTPYDCRTTFTTIWTRNRLSEIFRRKIQGHSPKGIGEEVYLHLTTKDYLEEVNKLPTEF